MLFFHFRAAGSDGVGFIAKQLPRGQETERQPLLAGLLSSYKAKTSIKRATCSLSSFVCACVHTHLLYVAFPSHTGLMRRESSKLQSEPQMVFDVWIMI